MKKGAQGFELIQPDRSRLLWELSGAVTPGADS